MAGGASDAPVLQDSLAFPFFGFTFSTFTFSCFFLGEAGTPDGDPDFGVASLVEGPPFVTAAAFLAATFGIVDAFDEAAPVDDSTFLEGRAAFEVGAGLGRADSFGIATLSEVAAFAVVPVPGDFASTGVAGSLFRFTSSFCGVRERGVNTRSHPKSAILLTFQ